MLQAVCVWWGFLEWRKGEWMGERRGEKEEIPHRSTCPPSHLPPSPSPQATCTFQCLCTLKRKTSEGDSNNARSWRENKRRRELFSELLRKSGVKWMQPSLKLRWILLATSQCYRYQQRPLALSSTTIACYCNNKTAEESHQATEGVNPINLKTPTNFPIIYVLILGKGQTH